MQCGFDSHPGHQPTTSGSSAPSASGSPVLAQDCQGQLRRWRGVQTGRSRPSYGTSQCRASVRETSLVTRIPVRTLGRWYAHPATGRQNMPATCPRCANPPQLPEPGDAYAYLLGLYLGDGCISRNGKPAKGIWVLRIACADAWPGLLAECKRAVKFVRPDNRVCVVPSEGCSYVQAYSRHWPCLFPQHGLGRKHERQIELASWQRTITGQYPGSFARGLFHSDGCRFANRVRRPLADGDRWYEYPRYMFTNQSQDILRICGEALDQLGVSWRFSRCNTISVARRDAVARLDRFVGPKY